MKIEDGYKKKIISILLIVALSFSAIWAYRQWRLLQNFIEEKSGYMLKRYQQQNRCLRELEKITTEIILLNEISEEVIEDIQYFKDEYFRYEALPDYYRHGYSKNRIDDSELETLIWETNRFLRYASSGKVKLTEKNKEFLRKINNKVQEINSIKEKYEFAIEAEEYERLFYSKVLADAINEMNDSIDIAWLRELDYETEYRKKSNTKKPNPEKVYGEKVFSEDEAKEVAQRFLGDLGNIERKSGGGESRYDDEKMIERVRFRSDNGYAVEVYIQGGKIKSISDREWDDFIEENGKEFNESKINISEEEAINKLMDFLKQRGFNSLEVIEVDKYGPELEVRFAENNGRYINMVADIDSKVNLIDEGRLLELSFYGYWEGLAYDDSGYDEALKGYETAKSELDTETAIIDEKLVGRRGEGFALDFYWRFTIEDEGEQYHIYINPETGKKDVRKIKR
ncbi:hypothetical protein R9X47_27910 [Wukongibacter baidiensis]|uniref:PepSY1/2 domain-containing protein n=1 Tax=Wukongibacter baidiensis TaxID=1723361 RepID=UPI003D7F75B5